MHVLGICVHIHIPVNRDIVFSLILDVDDEGVAVPDLNGWPRKHPIHRDDVMGVAQPLHWCFLNLYVSIHSNASANIETHNIEKMKQE